VAKLLGITGLSMETISNIESRLAQWMIAAHSAR
jgi:hypothetical protein